MDRIDKIQELIDEFADLRDKLDSRKIAVEIDGFYHKEREIAGNLEDYWACQRSGATQ